MILCRTINFDCLAQALAMDNVIFRRAFLTPCADDQDTRVAGGPRPTAAIAVAPADSQPNQEVARSGTVSTGTDAAGSSFSNPPVKVDYYQLSV